MGYKTISVTITDSQADAPVLAAAAALAQREDAHLDVYCVGVDQARYVSIADGSAAMLMELGLEEARKQSALLGTWAKAALPFDLEKSSVQTGIVSQLGLESDAARLVRYSDLVVTGKPYGKGHSSLQVAVLEAALFGTNAPVFIVPDKPANKSDAMTKPFSRIMVAWNESDEALSAIRRSLPLLQSAKHVDVVLVDPPSHSAERSDPGGSVSLFLARHGVKAEVSILARSLPQVSAVLLRFARENGVDAIVMGAYGHSRFREAILGGATRDMLELADIPVIMAR